MNPTIQRAIERSGEMWASVGFDRATVPVLIAESLGPRTTVYELTLPPNEGHPFWRVRERDVTEEEHKELVTKFGNCFCRSLGTLLPVNEQFYRLEFYVKNGRTDRWLPGGSFVKVSVEEV